MKEKKLQSPLNRREFLRVCGTAVAGGAIIATGVALGIKTKARAGNVFWQIDPAKCTQCGRCETHCALQEMKTGEAIKAVSKDVVIESVYFLYEGDPYSSSAIYYRTNLGDYVYFNGYGSDERLFSSEVFWAYMKATRMVWQATKKSDSVVMGSWPNYDICDLSAYDFRSPDFDPDKALPEIEMPESKPEALDYLWILGVAVLLAAGLGIWIFIKRKPKDVVDNIV